MCRSTSSRWLLGVSLHTNEDTHSHTHTSLREYVKCFLLETHLFVLCLINVFQSFESYHVVFLRISHSASLNIGKFHGFLLQSQGVSQYTWRAPKMMSSSSGNIFRVNGHQCGFPSQTPVKRSFDVFFDLHLNKRLNKQSRRRWFETPLHSLWRHCNEYDVF